MDTHSHRGQAITELLVIILFMISLFFLTNELGQTAIDSQSRYRFAKAHGR